MLSFLINPVYIWLIVMIVLLIAEVFTLTFSLLCLSIAAGITALMTLLGMNLYMQFAMFSTMSILSMIFIRPIALKILFNKKNTQQLGIDAYIGQHYKLIETLNNIEGSGQIKIGSEYWKAQSKNKEILEEGTVVIVKSIEGTTLFVEREKGE